MSVPIAVFASGRGSNFEAILFAIRSGKLSADVKVLVTDRPEARAVELANRENIPVLLVPVPKEGSRQERRATQEKQILDGLDEHSIRFIVLAGYMRVLSDEFIEQFRSDQGYTRIVNIHPSILPAFPGLNGYRQSFEYGCKVSGATVHLVEPEVDRGPICAQQCFSIEELTSVELVEEKGLNVEHDLYPRTLNWVLAENFVIRKMPGGRAIVLPS